MCPHIVLLLSITTYCLLLNWPHWGYSAMLTHGSFQFCLQFYGIFEMKTKSMIKAQTLNIEECCIPHVWGLKLWKKKKKKKNQYVCRYALILCFERQWNLAVVHVHKTPFHSFSHGLDLEVKKWRRGGGGGNSVESEENNHSVKKKFWKYPW